jgi:hypothetical protein
VVSHPLRDDEVHDRDDLRAVGGLALGEDLDGEGLGREERLDVPVDRGQRSVRLVDRAPDVRGRSDVDADASADRGPT